MESGVSQLKEAVIRKAWESESFKQKLFTDPKVALSEMGFSFPHNMEISVHQEHKNKMVLVLPENPLGNMNTVLGSTSPTQPGELSRGCPSIGASNCPPSEPKNPPGTAKPFPKPNEQPGAPVPPSQTIYCKNS